MNAKISKEYIASLLPNNPIVLEAGARFGKDTKRMSLLWPQGHIHTFEPVPALYKQLFELSQTLPNVTCYNMALADKIGTLELHVSSGQSDACSSLLAPHLCLEERPLITFHETIMVPVTTIDAWAAHYNVAKLDFLWLDLQGAELLALKGAEHMLNTVQVIQVEVNRTERYKHAPLYDDIITFLNARGFKLNQEAFHHETWGDALFIRAS
ncbi:MAG: FkbM family methyltransferase [Candidatus Babeliales bacterium]